MGDGYKTVPYIGKPKGAVLVGGYYLRVDDNMDNPYAVRRPHIPYRFLICDAVPS